MKKSVARLVLIACLIVLAGCKSSDTAEDKNTILKLQAGDEAAYITLSAGSGRTATIRDAAEIRRLTDALSAGEYSNGELDIRPADYGASVHTKNGLATQLSFWVEGGAAGLVVRSGHNGHYRLPEPTRAEWKKAFEAHLPKLAED